MWLEFFSASALTHQEKLYPVSEHPRPPFLKFLNCHTGFITLSATIKVSVQNHTKLLSPEVFENEKNTHLSKRSRSDKMNSQTPQVLLSNRLQIELSPQTTKSVLQSGSLLNCNKAVVFIPLKWKVNKGLQREGKHEIFRLSSPQN